MRKFWIGLLLLLFALPSRAQIPWEAAFYVELSSSPYVAELRLYRSDGEITAIPLPSALSSLNYTGPRDVLVSDDRRYIVVAENRNETLPFPPLRIADLENGTCCLGEGIVDASEDYTFAGFEPNGSRFAFTYVSPNADSSNPAPFVGGMMVADAATGRVVAAVTMRDAATATGFSEDSVWAFMGTWEQDGIRFGPNCYNCDGIFSGQYALWQPDTGGFVPNPGISYSLFGIRLDTTGEFLLRVQNRTFPFNPLADSMFPAPNVIQYTRANEAVNFSTGHDMPDAAVVYFNLDAISVRQVHWVADGAAFVVIAENTDFWDVVFRDGHVERVPLGGVENKRLLGGTPDGWFEQFTDAGGNTVVVHHNMDSTQSTVFSLDIVRNIKLIDAPRLGQTLPTSLQTFPLIAPPSPQERATIESQVSVSCAGFMTSRLVMGAQGRVTPGEPNRVRESPSTDSAIVGQIPGEGVFSVLEGPVCDPANGIAWWRVEYQGIIGWTAEGQGSEYWTEPLNP